MFKPKSPEKGETLFARGFSYSIKQVLDAKALDELGRELRKTFGCLVTSTATKKIAQGKGRSHKKKSRK
jgi:hypothetical protein